MPSGMPAWCAMRASCPPPITPTTGNFALPAKVTLPRISGPVGAGAPVVHRETGGRPGADGARGSE
ncbi:hypothetical protein GCM10009663_08220 [Kitasatospora arboriphila]|uniref:Uncharacterized protein n=1 Tax=Kitasatospora arboriphila TaxID=258052 RepID=A0ABN1TAS5_9ACTN